MPARVEDAGPAGVTRSRKLAPDYRFDGNGAIHANRIAR